MAKGSINPEWVAKAHPLGFDFFMICAVHESYQDELVALTGIPFNYKYEDQIIYYDQGNLDHYVDVLLDHPGKIEQHVRFVGKQIAALIKASEDYGGNEDFESFTTWYVALREFLPALGVVFGLETSLEKLSGDFLSEDDFHDIAFAQETPIAKEQRSLLGLGQYLNKPSELERRIERHLEKYDWIGNNFLNYSPFTKDEILKRLEAARSDYGEQLQKIVEERKRMERAAEVILGKVNEDQRKLIHLYQDVLFLRTARANAMARSASLTHGLFTAVAEEIGLTREELLRLSYDEIKKMRSGDEDYDVTRREQYCTTMVNGEMEVVWGSWGPRAEKVDGVVEIAGTVASKGVVSGTVRVVYELSDLDKVQRGDVLVSPYTNPNMIPAMERAVAFVTDIGGLTSHAAIVSREMGKPCIIGTRTATQVLNDGDEVEVNADEGVVKILRTG